MSAIKLAVRRMAACAETRHHSKGNAHSPDSPGLLRTSLAGDRTRGGGSHVRKVDRIGSAKSMGSNSETVLRLNGAWVVEGDG